MARSCKAGHDRKKLGHRITHLGPHLMPANISWRHLPHRHVSAFPGQCPHTGCRDECCEESESWTDESGELRSATICFGQAGSVEVVGELRRRQVGDGFWSAPHRDGCPEDAGGLAAWEWLGACTGASRDYDARDSRPLLKSSQRRPHKESSPNLCGSTVILQPASMTATL